MSERVILERLLLLPLGLDVVVLRLEAVHHTLKLRLKLIAHELVNHGIKAISWRCFLNLLFFLPILFDHLGPGYGLLLLHFEILTPVVWLSLLIPVKGLELLIDLSQ